MRSAASSALFHDAETALLSALADAPKDQINQALLEQSFTTICRGRLDPEDFFNALERTLTKWITDSSTL